MKIEFEFPNLDNKQRLQLTRMFSEFAEVDTEFASMLLASFLHAATQKKIPMEKIIAAVVGSYAMMNGLDVKISKAVFNVNQN